MRNQFKKNETGVIIIYEIIIVFIFTVAMLGVVSYASYQLKLINSVSRREEAFQIAEAGVNYYEWHLAHFPTDYEDGTNSAGPYLHNYIDEDTQQVLGTYSLTITAPTVGSTIVTIQSTGYTAADPNNKRTVSVRYGIPSLAKYAFLTNSDAWIGNTESVSGEFHTNGGVRFDGTGNAPITSSKQTYTCQPTFGCSPASTENGVWGAAPQSTQNYWSFPVPNVDFSAITSDLAIMKSEAQSNGIYLSASNAQGYSLVFNSNATVSIYKITSLKSTPTGYDVNGNAHNTGLDYKNRTLLSTQNLPANGVIYVEDKTWVEGTVNGRVLVAAAQLPYNSSTAPSIMIPNNLVYAAKDGTDVLGLVGQQDVLVTYLAPTNLEIDAALIAQNGSAQRYYFPNESPKNSITIYGATSSFGTWTWSWVDGSGNTVSGYTNTNTIYDSNLLFGPPPSFPLDESTGYVPITWTSK
jgi:hypothetical protein